MWVEDKYELDRLKTNAQEAIDKLKSIVAECERVRADAPYMKKKADTASVCVEYISKICGETISSDNTAKGVEA